MCVFLSLCFFKCPFITICNTVYFFVDATASVKLDNKYLFNKKKIQTISLQIKNIQAVEAVDRKEGCHVARMEGKDSYYVNTL